MSEYKRLVTNTFLIGLSKASAILSMVVLLPIMTRELTTGEYGFIDLVLSYSGLVAPLVVLAVDQGVWRFFMDAREDENHLRTVFSTAVFTALPTFAVSSAVYFAVTMTLHYKFGIELYMYMLSQVTTAFTTYALRGLGRNKEFTISAIIQSLANVGGISLALFVFHAGASGILIAYAVSGGAVTVYNILSCRLYRYVNTRSVDAGMRKTLVLYSLPNIPNSIAWWVLDVSNRTVLTVVIGSAANGIYAIACRFASVLAVAQSTFMVAWTESATLNFRSVERDRFFSDIFNKQFAVFGALAVLTLPATSLAFPILVAPEFNQAYRYIPVLVLAGLAGVILSFHSGIYLAMKASKKTATMSAWTAGINLAVDLSLVWLIGIWAAAVSTLAAYTAMAVYRHFDIRKHLHIRYSKPLFAAVLMAFAAAGGLYFWNLFWLNCLSLLLALVFAYVLNRDMVKHILLEALARLRRMKNS